MNDVSKYSDYRYRPELTEETKNNVLSLETILNIPRAALSNALINLGAMCLKKTLAEMVNDPKIKSIIKSDFLKIINP